MEKIIIQKQVCIEPRFMDCNIMSHITNELSRTCLNECHKDYGHIMKINRIIKVLDNYINMESNIIFDVKFEASCLVPKPDKVFTGQVRMIYQGGIFVVVMQKMEILVPDSLLAGYTFAKNINPKLNSFVKGEDKIEEGKQVKIKVTASQYNNQRFSVFGSLQ
jgi:DNA-directed RNA polymerase subunit E'/Rpb7